MTNVVEYFFSSFNIEYFWELLSTAVKHHHPLSFGVIITFWISHTSHIWCFDSNHRNTLQLKMSDIYTNIIKGARVGCFCQCNCLGSVVPLAIFWSFPCLKHIQNIFRGTSKGLTVFHWSPLVFPWKNLGSEPKKSQTIYKKKTCFLDKNICNRVNIGFTESSGSPEHKLQHQSSLNNISRTGVW